MTDTRKTCGCPADAVCDHYVSPGILKVPCPSCASLRASITEKDARIKLLEWAVRENCTCPDHGKIIPSCPKCSYERERQLETDAVYTKSRIAELECQNKALKQVIAELEEEAKRLREAVEWAEENGTFYGDESDYTMSVKFASELRRRAGGSNDR